MSKTCFVWKALFLLKLKIHPGEAISKILFTICKLLEISIGQNFLQPKNQGT